MRPVIDKSGEEDNQNIEHNIDCPNRSACAFSQNNAEDINPTGWNIIPQGEPRSETVNDRSEDPADNRVFSKRCQHTEHPNHNGRKNDRQEREKSEPMANGFPC